MYFSMSDKMELIVKTTNCYKEQFFNEVFFESCVFSDDCGGCALVMCSNEKSNYRLS